MSDSAFVVRRSEDHLSALDGMRGLAAIVVVLYHASLVFSQGIDSFSGGSIRHSAGVLSWLKTLPVRILVSGPQAVVLFFVLSGFVLARAVTADHYGSYGQYAIKRFFRIWPIFAFAILVSALLSWIIGRHNVPGGSQWLRELWARGGKPSNVWRHLLMTETRVDLDNVMWSLIHELRISLIFPLIFAVTVRHRIAACLLSVALMLLVASVSALLSNNPFLQSYVETLSYIFLFVFGVVLSLSMRSRTLKPEWKGYWPIFALVLCLVLLTLGPGDTAHVGTFFEGLKLLICGLGATGLIFIALTSSLMSLFTAKATLYLGRISYSLYLLHVIILAAVINGLAGQLSLGVSTAVALLLLIPFAELCYRLVERPTMRTGRRIANALRDRAKKPSTQAIFSLAH